MTRIINLIITCFILAATAVAQSDSSDKTPSIILNDLNGKIIKLADYKGKIILVNFWAMWCPPCLAEIPELIKWQKEFKDNGLQIIGITYPPTNRGKVRTFVRKMKINYPILVGSKKTKAIFDSGENLPLTVIIDEEGIVKELIEGILFSEEFDEKVKPLLKISKVNIK